MTDLIEKVADALQFNWRGNPGRRDEEEPLVRAAIAVVLRDLGKACDELEAENATLRGRLDRAREGLRQIANTFDGETGLGKIARSILSDLTEREDLPPNAPSTAQNLPSGKRREELAKLPNSAHDAFE